MQCAKIEPAYLVEAVRIIASLVIFKAVVCAHVTLN